MLHYANYSYNPYGPLLQCYQWIKKGFESRPLTDGALQRKCG